MWERIRDRFGFGHRDREESDRDRFDSGGGYYSHGNSGNDRSGGYGGNYGGNFGGGNYGNYGGSNDRKPDSNDNVAPASSRHSPF
jgi:hypothetical protein